MTKDNWKQVLISLLIGASVAFISTLFQGLLDILQQHANEIIGGGVSSLVYLTRVYRG